MRLSPQPVPGSELRPDGVGRQRLLAAQTQLETTDASIDQIADGVGFGSAATLRLHFARSLGTTPTAYRRRFAFPGRRRGVAAQAG